MNPLGVHALVFASGWSEPESERAIAGARRHGFEVLEIPLRDPGRIDVPRTRRLLEHAGLRPVTSMALGFSSDISSGDPENVARGEARLNLALSVARDLGAGLLTGVLYSAKGRYRSPPTEAGRWNSLRVLARLAERAAAANLTLGLEAVNRYDSNLVNTAGEARALIEQIGAPNLVVHLDSYHMNLEEGDPAAAIERAGARLGYVQIGESHRGYLGTGTIDFGTLFRALAKIGYQGPITFEAFSAGGSDPALAAELAVWRQIWTDGNDIARHARRFMAAECEAAAHRIS
jgi:D-psicose/D-tagatose/L-ribulose 3-epimerase